jgi:hypothetical protein
MIKWLLSLFKGKKPQAKKEVMESARNSQFVFSQRSLNNLKGVHPDLVLLAHRALKCSTVDFAITEGLRSKERQAELYATGASKTLNSRHLTGHAIDVAAFIGGKISWDWDLYERINKAFMTASLELDIAYEWGGSWQTIKDGVHFQLRWEDYR